MKKIILILLVLLPTVLFSQNIDIKLLRVINSPQDLHSDPFFRTVSNSDMYVITGVPITMAIIGLTRHDDKLLRNACVTGGATVINLGITAILKYSINRSRPFTTYSDIVNKTGKPLNDPSFPSGHTSTAFTMATSISLEYPKWYVIIPVYTYAGTVAYSRMHLGAHYPSDVIVGSLIGAGSAYLTHIINKKILWKSSNY